MIRRSNCGIWRARPASKLTGTTRGNSTFLCNFHRSIFNECLCSMVTSLAFHPSGTIFASASSDRSIKLFDIRNHKLIQHYGDAHGALYPNTESSSSVGVGGGVNSISFGGDNGEWLISTGMDGLVKVQIFFYFLKRVVLTLISDLKIWDLKEGHLFYTLHGHKDGPTTTAAFSPRGDYFSTGGSDSQVMVWKTNFDALLQDSHAIPEESSQKFKPQENSRKCGNFSKGQ